jgi:hypothetical protein
MELRLPPDHMHPNTARLHPWIIDGCDSFHPTQPEWIVLSQLLSLHLLARSLRNTSE